MPKVSSAKLIPEVVNEGDTRSAPDPIIACCICFGFRLGARLDYTSTLGLGGGVEQCLYIDFRQALLGTWLCLRNRPAIVHGFANLGTQRLTARNKLGAVADRSAFVMA